MAEGEFAGFRERSIQEWADDVRVVEGLDSALALAAATEDFDTNFPDGLATPNRVVFVIEADRRPIGWVWMEMQAAAHAHVADIWIEEASRGSGHGTRALELVEAEAARSGATSIGLNVFTHNPRAHGLYERLGFRPFKTQLRKELGV
jgi:ribosomal protein S18 acetylase RimI-like enzyme